MKNLWGEKRSLVSEDTVNRLQVIEQFERGLLTRTQAAQVLLISERQFTRIKERFLKAGALGLEHQLRGRSPPNKTSELILKTVRGLLETRYYGFNVKHAVELMRENDGLNISYDVVYRLAKTHQLLRRKSIRSPRVRKLRKRYSNTGFMLQMDGSEHRWFKGQYSTLISLIDDANSDVPYGEFVENENLQGVLSVLRKTIELRGIPHVLYVDRAKNFGWLQGEEEMQFGRVCRELGIKIIYANSPQGKGRIERLWHTLQDRLCSEFRLNDISSMKEATDYFNQRFLPETWVKKFRVEPKSEKTLFRPIPEQAGLNEVFSMKHDRKIRNDHTILWNNEIYLIQASLTCSLVGRYAEVRVYSDGSFKAFYAGRNLELEKAQTRNWSKLRESPKHWAKAKVQETSPYK